MQLCLSLIGSQLRWLQCRVASLLALLESSQVLDGRCAADACSWEVFSRLRRLGASHIRAKTKSSIHADLLYRIVLDPAYPFPP